MLIIKAKHNLPREEMKNMYRNLLEQKDLGLIFVDDNYEISVVEPSREWISVNDALPEKNDYVLVTDGEDVFVGWYTYDWNSDDFKFHPATHPIKAWMPLPEPYNEKEEKE